MRASHDVQREMADHLLAWRGAERCRMHSHLHQYAADAALARASRLMTAASLQAVPGARACPDSATGRSGCRPRSRRPCRWPPAWTRVGHCSWRVRRVTAGDACGNIARRHARAAQTGKLLAAWDGAGPGQPMGGATPRGLVGAQPQGGW